MQVLTINNLPIGHSTNGLLSKVKPGASNEEDVQMVEAMQAAVAEGWLLSLVDFNIVTQHR